jgi:hypothetical protein
MAGVGKTVLTAALARDGEVVRAFPGGIFWATLGQTPEDHRLLLGQVARAATGAPPLFASVEEGRLALARSLAGQPHLFVLDDCCAPPARYYRHKNRVHHDPAAASV